MTSHSYLSFLAARPVRSEAEALLAGRRKIRFSQATALGVAGLLLGSRLFDWRHWWLGFGIGLLYSNGFEYLVHRLLLHGTTGYFHRAHERHHQTWGEWEEALYVRFGPPAGVVALFVANSLPLALADRLGAAIGGGALVAFLIYYLLYEELHWRIHLGSVPRWLAGLRRRHFEHHRGVPGRYNVLLPLCDRLLGGG